MFPHSPCAFVFWHRNEKTMLPFLRTLFCAFVPSSLKVYLVIMIQVSFFSPLSYPPPLLVSFPACPGKSVVSEPEDEVQAAEVGRRRLRVAAEEEGIASHKPVETGDEAGEPGGNRCHLGRLNCAPPPSPFTHHHHSRLSGLKEDVDKGCRVETVRG